MNKKKMEVIIYFYILLILGFLVVIFSENILPDKYFIDSNTIREYFDIANDFSLKFFEGFWNTAWLYKLMLINKLDSRVLEGIVNYSIYYICLIFTILLLKKNIPLKYALLLLVWNIPAAIYLGQLTKEIFIVPILVLQIVAFQKKSRFLIFLSILLIIFYAMFFRNYWLIIICMTIMIFLVRIYFIKYNFIVKTFMVISGMLAIFVVANFGGMYLTDSRFNVNEILESETMINNLLINTSVFSDLVNWFIAWVSILFPLPLLVKGGLTQKCFLILAIYTFYVFIKCIRRYNKNSKETKDYSVEWSIAFVISFSMVQGIFEPDYGSVLKHQVVMIPMYFYVILYCHTLLDKRSNKDS